MKSEKERYNLFLEYADKNPELKNASVRLFLEILPSVLVDNDLDDLYLENELQALSKISEIINFSNIKDFKWFVVHDDFPSVKEKIFGKLENLNESDSDEVIMILFYAVSSFESMVNHHLKNELDIKNFSGNDINRIYRLPVEEKLSWLLKLICGSGYTDNENWKLIKKFVEARNFFIHYKPTRLDNYHETSQLLTKDSLIIFLDAAYDCYSFLKECHTDEYKRKLNRIERIKSLIQERYSEYYSI